jgi:hypothetical protein
MRRHSSNSHLPVLHQPMSNRYVVETDKTYKYRPSIWESGSTCSLLNLQIDVRADSDCHIWLCDRERDSRGYEIVIGGWKGSRSEIRRGKQGDALCSVFHDSAAKPLRDGQGRFWVSVMPNDNDVTIVVGKGWDLWKDKFMIAVDKSRKKIATVSSVSVCTGFGSEGHWTIYVDSQTTEDDAGGSGRSIIMQKPSTAVSTCANTPKLGVRKSSVFSTPIRDTIVSTAPSSVLKGGNGGANLLKRPRMQPASQHDNQFLPENFLTHINDALAKHGLIEPNAKRRR